MYVRMYIHIYIHKVMVAIWTDKTEIKPCGARNYSTQCLPLCYCTEKAKLPKPTDVALSLPATVQQVRYKCITYILVPQTLRFFASKRKKKELRTANN